MPVEKHCCRTDLNGFYYYFILFAARPYDYTAHHLCRISHDLAAGKIVFHPPAIIINSNGNVTRIGGKKYIPNSRVLWKYARTSDRRFSRGFSSSANESSFIIIIAYYAQHKNNTFSDLVLHEFTSIARRCIGSRKNTCFSFNPNVHYLSYTVCCIPILKRIVRPIGTVLLWLVIITISIARASFSSFFRH